MASIQFEQPLTQAQDTAWVFFAQMNRADRLGLRVAAQRELHERWAATTTILEKLAVCDDLHLTLLDLGDE